MAHELKRDHEGYLPEDLVRLFLKYGSVERVRSRFPNIMSYASYQRLISEKGIIKSPNGRPSFSLGALTEFFRTVILEERGIFALNQYPAHEITYDNRTLYRVLKRVRKQEIKKYATGLIVHPEGRKDQMLVGWDTSLPETSKNWTAPVTYSGKGEDTYLSILRTMQQEVSSNRAAEGRLSPSQSSTYALLKPSLAPVFIFDLLDVRVSVHALEVPYIFIPSISSERLTHFRFESINAITQSDPMDSYYRTGVVEFARIYKQLLEGESNTISYQSEMNRYLEHRNLVL